MCQRVCEVFCSLLLWWSHWQRDPVLHWAFKGSRGKRARSPFLDEGALSWMPKERESPGYICKTPDCWGWKWMMMYEWWRCKTHLCFVCFEQQGVSWLYMQNASSSSTEIKLIQAVVFQGHQSVRESCTKADHYHSVMQFWDGGGLWSVLPLKHWISPACLESAIPDGYRAPSSAVYWFHHSGQVLLIPPQSHWGDRKPTFVWQHGEGA